MECERKKAIEGSQAKGVRGFMLVGNADKNFYLGMLGGKMILLKEN